jgi:hypothetical protein
MTRVIDGARGRFDTLRLRTNSEAAARLDTAMGFRPVAGAASSRTCSSSCRDPAEYGA